MVFILCWLVFSATNFYDNDMCFWLTVVERVRVSVCCPFADAQRVCCFDEHRYIVNERKLMRSIWSAVCTELIINTTHKTGKIVSLSLPLFLSLEQWPGIYRTTFKHKESAVLCVRATCVLASSVRFLGQQFTSTKKTRSARKKCILLAAILFVSGTKLNVKLRATQNRSKE